MGKDIKIKRILDSVHGYIDVPSNIVKDFVDTTRFQRLRRIEQTSGRSIYPSAHHDRFIHSLGVYHIGSQIVKHLQSIKDFYVNPDLDKLVFKSYLLACLLHDVCHAPFSHTFENKFGKAGMLKRLQELKIDDKFVDDSSNESLNIATHEIMSAYISWEEFSDKIKTHEGDPTLVVRMICGIPYTMIAVSDEDLKANSFKNSMIELIHGDIIDADGMDYACRDAWASGYDTNNVDIDRLVESIELHIDVKSKQYKVCYSTKALNAIESVLGVKTFQQYNVINHHKVVYEQHLIKKAIERTAFFHCAEKKGKDLNDQEKKNCLKEFYNFDAFLKPQVLSGSKCLLYAPMDDDYVYLMKYVSEDEYVHQWLSRDYNLMPLWKSPAEFYEIFDYLQDRDFIEKMWLFTDNCREEISKRFDIDSDNIWTLSANGKEKRVKAKNILLWVNGRICKYDALYRDHKDKYRSDERPFFYMYVPKEADTKQIIEFLKEETQKKVF